MTYLSTIHLIVLVLFTFSTTILMMVTVSNAIRLRNVEISWKSGKLFGYPLFATLFLLFTFTLTFHVYFYQLNAHYIAVMCYNWIGMTWFVTSYLTSKRFVTDHGIVKNINDPSQTVAWSRIMDYVKRNNGKGQTCVFFYPDTFHGKRPQNIRLELDIPADKKQAFEHVLQKKLGKRFSPEDVQHMGIKQYLN